MRICCLVSSLGSGGAERVMALLASQWAARGRDVTIVTLAALTGDVYELDPRVKRVALALEVESRSPVQAIKHNVRKILGLRRALRAVSPDVVISFGNKLNVLAILATAGLEVPTIVSERSHPGWDSIGYVWSLLRRVAYPFADALIVQSRAARVWADKRFVATRTHAIPNPVTPVFSAPENDAPIARKPIVLAVGRLSPEKRFDLLIRAFASVSRKHAEWALVIVGQGPRSSDLMRLAAALLPEKAVVFPGLVKDVEHYYREAGLFVLSSRYEGFPNALIEAMACGCPVIATDCPGGTAEIVRHGVDGVLIPPEELEPLAREMDRLMGDAAERYRLGTQAAEVSGRFGVDRILSLWEGVLSRVGHQRRGREGSASDL